MWHEHMTSTHFWGLGTPLQSLHCTRNLPPLTLTFSTFPSHLNTDVISKCPLTEGGENGRWWKPHYRSIDGPSKEGTINNHRPIRPAQPMNERHTSWWKHPHDRLRESCFTWTARGLEQSIPTMLLQRLWVIWGQCCLRVTAGPCLPNSPISQLSPYLTWNPCKS